MDQTAEEMKETEQALKDVRSQFHRLWTKAVGTQDYDKGEWKNLVTTLSKLGIYV